MTKCILIFKEIEKCVDLLKIFEERSIIISQAILIKPNDDKINSEQEQILLNLRSNLYKIENIENNRILNPKLDREIRQKGMKKLVNAIWIFSRFKFFKYDKFNDFFFSKP